MSSKYNNILSGKPGEFVIGCNYWASHAGTAMWADWQPDIVEGDLKKLSKCGIQVLRVFPIWPDFQPLNLLLRGINELPEFTHGEIPLPDNEAGQAGMSAEQISNFKNFLDIAEKYGLKLIVGLITGWMSGRLFVPPALERRNLITDPVAVMWQIRFVKYFVNHFIDSPTIVAWEPGNECNCMSTISSGEQAWVWLSTIVNTIRSVDCNRPILSGISTLGLTYRKNPPTEWKIQDVGELVDFLTPHPYPVFTPHTDLDPINTMRSCLLATVYARINADIGKKPSIVEEINTFGPMFGDDNAAVAYIRSNFFSLWAHDCHGLFWWCGFDQRHLSHAPYEWSALELELGLFHSDGNTPKPLVYEITKFRNFLDELPFRRLPSRTVEAVCILTEGQDQWGIAFNTFILAKQAGFDIEFQYADQPLKKAPLYLLPCISGWHNTGRRRWLELLDYIKKGATLYISYNDGFLTYFEEVTGLRIETREQRNRPADIIMNGLRESPTLSSNAALRLSLKVTHAKTLGKESDGNPAFTCSRYGKGKVFFLSFPMEMELATHPGAFHADNAKPHRQIYEHVFSNSTALKRAAVKTEPHIGMTEHPLDKNSRIIIMINYSPHPVKMPLNIVDGWQLKNVLYGEINQNHKKESQCAFRTNDAVVFTVVKKHIKRIQR